MPPTNRLVTAFAAEPPQGGQPDGRWADRLRVEFLAACLRLDDEGEDLGQAGDLAWYPDRTYNGRTYVPLTSRTTTGYELYGHVSFVPRVDGAEPTELDAIAEFTAEIAEENPDWKLDLCEDVIGRWRGELGKVAQMTLVWGRPLTRGGKVVTAELAGLVVDQCTIADERFTLVAPDDYRGDVLDIKLWGTANRELASESLYEDDEDEDTMPPSSAGAGEAA